jgi:predicted DNA-binding transcriptional regulator AlpA
LANSISHFFRENQMNHQFLTSGEVADAVGLSRSRFLYLLEAGDVPGPTHTVPGRRLFTSEDVDRIKRAMAARQAKEEE